MRMACPCPPVRNNIVTLHHVFFLGTTKHLYNWLCPSVGCLVGRSVWSNAFVQRSTRCTLLAYLALLFLFFVFTIFYFLVMCFATMTRDMGWSVTICFFGCSWPNAWVNWFHHHPYTPTHDFNGCLPSLVFLQTWVFYPFGNNDILFKNPEKKLFLLIKKGIRFTYFYLLLLINLFH